MTDTTAPDDWRALARDLARRFPAQFGDPARRLRRLRRQVQQLREEIAARAVSAGQKKGDRTGSPCRT